MLPLGPVLLKSPSSLHRQYRKSHAIYSHQFVVQPIRAFCQQQPCSVPQQLCQRPAVASRAQKTEVGGSCSRKVGAQSAVLRFAFPSDTALTSLRGWTLLHIFHPTSQAAEVPDLQHFLHPLAAAMTRPSAVGAECFPLWLDGGLHLTRGSQAIQWSWRCSKRFSHCSFPWESIQPAAVPVSLQSPSSWLPPCREESWGLKMCGVSGGDAPGCQTPSPIPAWSTACPALTDMSCTPLHLAWHWPCWLSIPKPSSALRWVSGPTPQHPSWEWRVECVCVQELLMHTRMLMSTQMCK